MTMPKPDGGRPTPAGEPPKPTDVRSTPVETEATTDGGRPTPADEPAK